jgi:UDP-N-acetylmuramate--alanine ligase
MKQLKIPASYSVGTTLKFGPSGKFESGSKYFLYECDEYDRNFLHFEPYMSLIPSIDYDHPDTYPTETEYLEAFKQFATGSHRVIAWQDQHGELFSNMPQATMLNTSDINVNITLAGVHNRRNATLVQEAVKQLGFSDTTDDILNSFPGTDRRFEKLAENLYCDYGHHPIEIAATLQLARELSDHVVLVYQPHQNVRQHKIHSQYTNQFELADSIYWLPTYLSREDPNLPILKPEDLIQDVTNKNDVHVVELDDNLWQIIQNKRKTGQLVLLMGAGLIDNWARNKLAESNR